MKAIIQHAKDRLNRLLTKADLEIARHSHMRRLIAAEREYRRVLSRVSYDGAGLAATGSARPALDPGAVELLRPDHPRLAELQQAYAALDLPMRRASQWTEEFTQREIDLTSFRADNAYVWQGRDFNVDVNYLLTARYVRDRDPLNLLHRLEEDGMFGAYSVRAVNDILVSRDLLDSIVEIYFLERHLALSGRSSFSVLDIGAGYGRFAHRLVGAFPDAAEVRCVDSVAASTFLSEFYLDFRDVNSHARTVPLHELETVLGAAPFEMAVNIHSFSECPVEAVSGWMSLVRDLRIPHLMVVPNAGFHGGHRILSLEADKRQVDLLPAFAAYGYALVAKEPKYLDADVQRFGVSPTHHYLFELRES